MITEEVKFLWYRKHRSETGTCYLPWEHLWCDVETTYWLLIKFVNVMLCAGWAFPWNQILLTALYLVMYQFRLEVNHLIVLLLMQRYYGQLTVYKWWFQTFSWGCTKFGHWFSTTALSTPSTSQAERLIETC